MGEKEAFPEMRQMQWPGKLGFNKTSKPSL
jgi:hypothetical protein